MENATIAGFQKEYRFLSNFYQVPILFEGIVYPNAECAFQAQKTHSQSNRAVFSKITCPKAAKAYGRQIQLRPDWNQVSLQIMEAVVYAKFAQNPDLKRRLSQTEGSALIEKNTWNDRFWGTDLQLNGLNHLGRILEKVRKTLCHLH